MNRVKNKFLENKVFLQTILAVIFCFHFTINLRAQCATPIINFPYTEGFEISNGGWFSGGTGNDWVRGSPSKAKINTAGKGAGCWITGGLTNATYTNNEASWLQSPCFNFTNISLPYISFLVYWETEQLYDGAALQYSLNNGASWTTIGNANEADNCINAHWYNQPNIRYLTPLTTTTQGWSGNSKASAGSCRGGNGSYGWVTASKAVQELAGKPAVIFRFIFGTGTQCSNYDGFAIDEFFIGEAPTNAADFDFNCSGADNLSIDFKNNSSLCPTGFVWDFDDPLSANNSTTLPDASHRFSAPGTYDVSLTVSGPAPLSPSTIKKTVTVIGVTARTILPADCQTNLGGSANATVIGSNEPASYTWSTNPVQTTATATNLPGGTYNVTVEGENVCKASTSVTIDIDTNCAGIFFPNVFTPNGDGINDGFGVIGAIGTISAYTLSIYNRWGQLIFQTNNPSQKWHGRHKSQFLDSNAFVWFANFTVANQQPEQRKGQVLLVR